MSEPFRILLVDDHEIIRKGLKMLLADEPNWQICGEAGDGKQALEKVAELRPHLVVLDLSMPNMNGVEAAREIRRSVPSTKIVVLSMHDSSQMVQSAQDAGADAFVVKSAAANELLTAVRRLLRESSQDPSECDPLPSRVNRS